MKETSEFPDIVYKYCPPDRLEPLEEHTLRITPFNELNDPWECMPILESTNVKNSWSDALFCRFKEAGGRGDALGRKFKSYAKKFAHSQKTWKEAFSPAADNVQKLRNSFHFQKGMSQDFGVVCVSAREDSALMWSHYTKQHEGYVIGIRPTRFIDLHNAKTAKFSEVDYQNERVKVYRELEDSGNQGLFFRKSLDWGYEKEWRLVSLFWNGRNCTKNPRIKLINYGAENLIEIIVGFRAGDDLGARINGLRRRLPHVKLKFACPSTLSFDLRIYDEVPEILRRGID